MPEMPGLLRRENDISLAYQDLQLMKSAQGGDTYRAPSLGMDLSFNGWTNQYAAYRQQLMVQVMEFSKNVEEVRGPITHIVSEVFRRGIHWRAKFAVKCSECNIEYAEELPECEKCHNKDSLRKPSLEERARFEPFFRDCNIFDNSFEEVMRACWTDLQATDDLFLYLVKEYCQNSDGTTNSKVVEMRRLNPAYIEWDLDRDGLPKNQYFVCYVHRENEASDHPGACSECGANLIPAMYRYWYRGKVLHLLDSEIVHTSKWSPSETFGYSPVLTVMRKVMTIVGMDFNVYRYFWERQMPASMLMVFTDDAESLRREREHIASKMRQDPNYVPMVAVSTKQARGRVDMVRLFHTLQEMDYLPVREEIRERIAAMWGVTPAWQGAPDAYGGLSSQTQQLTVMSRVIESDQRIAHEKVFPMILEAFGIKDWVFELPQPEEKAEATRISFAQQRISAANMLVQMGFKVKTKSTEVGLDDIEFSVSGEAMTPMEQQQQQMEMMGGGMPGADMGGGEGAMEAPATPEGGDMGAGLQQMQKSQMFVKQIENKGYRFPIVKQVAPDLSWVLFSVFGLGDIFKASFANGVLVHVEKYVTPRMHSHAGYPPHDVSIKHRDTLSSKQRNENQMFDSEQELAGMEVGN